jgi:hypothetical protein
MQSTRVKAKIRRENDGEGAQIPALRKLSGRCTGSRTAGWTNGRCGSVRNSLEHAIAIGVEEEFGASHLSVALSRGCLASSRHNAKYPATNAHSSSLTSLGYPVRYCFPILPCRAIKSCRSEEINDRYKVHRRPMRWNGTGPQGCQRPLWGGDTIWEGR